MTGYLSENGVLRAQTDMNYIIDHIISWVKLRDSRI